MIKSFKVGDVLSESSHYKVLADNGNLNFKLKHLESGDMVYIGKEYIHNYLESADDFTNEVKVTREDKKDGTLGIRSIFEGIHGSQVFTVCFKKQDTPKSKKKLQAELDAIIEQFSNRIESVKASKKGVADAAKNLVSTLVVNPILPYEEVKTEYLEASRFNLKVEMADITA